MHRTFLLSPAHCGGKRAQMLVRPEASFDLAARLRSTAGASLGEVFSFLSGLYFRGKLAYAARFASPPPGLHGAYVITTNRGLLPPATPVRRDELCAMGATSIDAADAAYSAPLRRDARAIAAKLPDDAEVILLGSIATGKYVDVLLDVFGDRLKFPADFVGRGDMSRGGLMLRCVDSGSELSYAPVATASRRGKRPERLIPRPRGRRASE